MKKGVRSKAYNTITFPDSQRINNRPKQSLDLEKNPRKNLVKAADLKENLAFQVKVIDRKKVVGAFKLDELERILIKKFLKFSKRVSINSVEFVFDTIKKPKMEGVMHTGNLHVDLAGKNQHLKAEGREPSAVLRELIEKFENTID
ncbi:MAG: hypothetical protein N2558_01110 [Patescibacteria group bacterium]|nr:hypothetical protein [Patescibacteria group bacterium]